MLKHNNKTMYEIFMFGNVLRCDIHHLKKKINSVIDIFLYAGDWTV